MQVEACPHDQGKFMFCWDTSNHVFIRRRPCFIGKTLHRTYVKRTPFVAILGRKSSGGKERKEKGGLRKENDK